jgi:hypothetical protein
MKMWSFYHAQTGLFSRRRLGGTQLLKVPEGHVAIEGVFRPGRHRFDFATGKVVDYQAPPPDDDHEWNATLRRWVKRPHIVARETRRRIAQQRVNELELKAMRPQRELRRNPGDQSAAQVFQSIEDEIESIVPILRGE